MQQLEEQEEGRMELHGEYASLQEEVDSKKKKLKKVLAVLHDYKLH